MFAEYFREAFEDILPERSSGTFPYAKILGDIMLIGVNSIAEYSRIRNPLGSNGEVSEAEHRHLQRLISDPAFASKRKIVLIHHHFHKLGKIAEGTMHSLWEAMERQTMKLRGRKELVTMFREANVEIVLHGHVHENREYFRKGVRFLNGGGAVIDRDSPDPKVNFLIVTTDGIQTEMHRVPVDTSFVRSGRIVLEPLITNPTAA
jgi:3',5'-cyclic AMP phosphodiesterase CpdA